MKRLKQLWQIRRIVTIPPGAPRLNCLAALIASMAVGVLFLTFHAKPAGGGLGTSARTKQQQISVSLGSSRTSAAVRKNGPGSLSLDELNKAIHKAIHNSRLALKLHVALLEIGKHRLEHFPDYTATFIKQEKVDGADLQELQTIQLKLRHKPFSVYMKWLEGGDVGRELLYAEGQYDDKLQVRLGGRKKLLPVLKLEPTSSMAMKESRHAATNMGLLNLTELILEHRKSDLTLSKGVSWEMVPDQKFMNHVCDCWVVEYDSRDVSPVYRKTITYIDKETSLPISIKNFGWPDETVSADDPSALDEATLIEYYGYTDIKFEHRLTDADFDKGNTEYTFKR